MSELVERLLRDHELDTRQSLIDMCADAADEIERLRADVAKLRGNADYEQTLGRKVDALEAENHRLRAALVQLSAILDLDGPEFAPCMCFVDPSGLNEAMANARAALEQKE